MQRYLTEMIRIFKSLNKHKIFIIMMIILCSYIGTINSDYVVQDACITQSGDYIPVTADASIRMEILPARQHGFRSVLLSPIRPSCPSDLYMTQIRIFQDEELLYEKYLQNDEDIDIDDPYGNAAEFAFDEPIDTDPDCQYFLEISSNAVNADNAFCFAADKSGNVWSRLVYRMFTRNERMALSFLFVFVLSVISYYLLIYGNGKIGMKHIQKSENLFLAVSIPLCVFYMLAIPVFQVPDEVNHYVRAWGIVKGYWLVPSNGCIDIPDNLIPYSWYTYTPYILFKNFIMEINTSGTEQYNVVNMALYSPVSYLFQVIGIAAGSLTNNTYIMVILGRICNMAGCTVILYYAIKWIPYGKDIILFFSLLPMTLQERASLSVDAITYCMVIAVLAFCLYLRRWKLKMTAGHYMLLYVILIMLASCKVVYFAAAALILLIPKECFESRKKSLFHKAAGLCLTGCITLGWLSIASGYLNHTRGGGSASEKIQFVFSTPVRYLYIINKTIWNEGEELLYQMMGSNLGSLDIIVNHILILFLILVLLLIVYDERNKCIGTDFGAKIILWFTGIGIMLLIVTSLYIQWTVIEASTYSIEGLQGRYFLPVAPLIVCALISGRARKDDDAGRKSIRMRQMLFAVFVVNLIVILEVLKDSSFS